MLVKTQPDAQGNFSLINLAQATRINIFPSSAGKPAEIQACFGDKTHKMGRYPPDIAVKVLNHIHEAWEDLEEIYTMPNPDIQFSTGDNPEYSEHSKLHDEDDWEDDPPNWEEQVNPETHQP